MSQAALKTLWSLFAGTTLPLSFLLFLRTTGIKPDNDTFGLLGFAPRELPVLGLPVILVMLCITLWLTRVWGAEVGGPTWAHRMPTFYFERRDLDPGSRGGRLYQGWTLGLALGLPLAAAMQMYARFLAGDVYVNGSSAPTGIKGWGHFRACALHAVQGDTFLRYGSPDGPQYYAEHAWMLTLLGLFALAYWARVVYKIFRP